MFGPELELCVERCADTCVSVRFCMGGLAKNIVFYYIMGMMMKNLRLINLLGRCAGAQAGF